MAGRNLTFQVWRDVELADDEVGGSQVTGTSIGYVYGRIQEEPGEQMLLQQGYETTRQFTVVSDYPTFEVREKDKLEVVVPGDHHYYGDKFRVMRVKYPSMGPRNPNRYMIFKCTRSVEAHDVQ
jgi:hypothetical protein